MAVTCTYRKRSICRFSYSSLFIFMFLAFALIFFPPGIASAGQVTLEWDENSESDLAGYKIFFREEGQNYDYTNPAWQGTESTCTINDLDDNTAYYFVARAYDLSERESDNSNEVFFAIYSSEGGTDPGDSCAHGKVYDCAGNCVDEQKAESWIGDGYCDNGSWGMDLRCDAFDNDGGDCGGSPPTSSCQGICGQQHPSGCWCDDKCQQNGDCCPDYDQECDGVPLPDSCEGRCGQRAPAGCWCDDKCQQYGDCCPDYDQECDGVPLPDSCEGHCGQRAPAGCWCDDKCQQYGDCCDDYDQVCL